MEHTGISSDITAKLTSEMSPSWPSFTNLIVSAGGKVNLTLQNHEIKCVLRKTFPKANGFIIFVDAYPSQSECFTMIHSSLLKSAGEIADMGNNPHIAARYVTVRDRLKIDEKYWRALAKIVRTVVHRKQ